MKDQVLTIEQMEELEELGIDISGASMCWEVSGDKPELTINTPTMNKGIDMGDFIIEFKTIPTFTLQDILTLLKPYHRLMVIRHEPNEWVDSAFKLLKFQYKDRNN